MTKLPVPVETTYVINQPLVHSRPVSEQKCPEIPVRVSPNQPVSFSPIAPQPSSFKFGDQGQSTSPQPSGNSPPVIKTPRVKRILKGFQRTPTPHPKGYAFHKATPQAPVNKTSTSPELLWAPFASLPGSVVGITWTSLTMTALMTAHPVTLDGLLREIITDFNTYRVGGPRTTNLYL